MLPIGQVTRMKRLLMYTRQQTCADQERARLCLKEFGVAATEINISREPEAAQILNELVGCLAVPTLVVAGEDDNPIEPPSQIGQYGSVRDADRGAVISEPSREGLRQFLIKHGFLSDGQA